MEEVDHGEPVKKSRELAPAVANDQVPAAAKLVRNEEAVGRFAGLLRQIDTVELALSIPGKRGQYVGAGRTVQHAGLNDNTRPSRTHNYIKSFVTQRVGRSQSLGSGKLPQRSATGRVAAAEV